MNLIDRKTDRTTLSKFMSLFPVTAILGPRQSGKTTLCRDSFPGHPYANLEFPDIRTFAQDDPRALLDQFPDGAVIDEIQRCPDLLSYLQGRIDEDPRVGRWILTGSQNLLLLESVGQSLAGRVALLHLLPLSRNETTRFARFPRELDECLLTGGYPRILDQGLDPGEFLDGYLATYVERDVRTVTRVGDLSTFRRFMALCAGRTGQILNFSSLASDAGISQPTARAWLSVMEACFIIFLLPAWHGNLRKRLVKRPKLHFWDSGLVCRLLGIRNHEQLHPHPLRGAIFESWMAAEVAKQRWHRGDTTGLFHFRDQHGLEVDLLIDDPQGVSLIEAKTGSTLALDMWDAMTQVADLFPADRIARRCLLYGGQEMQDRSAGSALPWHAVAEIDCPGKV